MPCPAESPNKIKIIISEVLNKIIVNKEEVKKHARRGIKPRNFF